jgi:hypothetical protein
MKDKNSLLLHTDTLSVFSEKYFEKVLGIEHIVSNGAVHFQKVKATDGEELEINFFGWVVEKDGVSWLIPSKLKDGTNVKVKDIFPLIPTNSDEVGFQNKAYRIVYDYQTVKFRSENRLGMKKLIDTLADTPHSNPKHRKLLIMAILSQVFNRAYFRFSSPPGFGKDSIVDTLGLLIGGCATIENPSVPKLEREASIRKLCGLNEVVGISRKQWVDIGKFMLAACAFKPSVTKRTRAFGGVGEVISLRDFSMSVFFNDNTEYVDDKVVFFDDLAEGGVRDRLPALRLYGNFTYDFNIINTVNLDKFVTDNWNDFLDIIYTITYYSEHLGSVKYSYNLSKFPNRWQRSLGVLLMVVSEYCKDQKEFDEWLKVLDDSMLDYKAMVEYPNMLEVVKKKVSQKVFNECSEKLIKEHTFINRIKILNNYLVEKPKEDVNNKDLRIKW